MPPLLIIAIRCLCVCAVLLAGCASTTQESAAQPTTAAVSEEAVESGEPGTEATTSEPPLTTTTTAAATTSVAESQAGAGSESTPTTETPGLAASPASTTAPQDLTCVRLEDFGDDSPDRWVVVNDGVMGGRSMGELREDGGVVRFSGNINTNGGGFSLIRTSTLRGDQSLSEALDGVEYLRFRVRSANGRGYELIAEDDNAPSGAIMHFAPIPVDGSGDWVELAVPLSELDARAFGTPVPTSAPFDITQVSSIGVILADGVDGPFSLEIDRIDACERSDG